MSLLQFQHVFSSYKLFLWELQKGYALTHTVSAEEARYPGEGSFAQTTGQYLPVLTVYDVPAEREDTAPCSLGLDPT